jgi:hypothetical protein
MLCMEICFTTSMGCRSDFGYFGVGSNFLRRAEAEDFARLILDSEIYGSAAALSGQRFFTHWRSGSGDATVTKLQVPAMPSCMPSVAGRPLSIEIEACTVRRKGVNPGERTTSS